MIYEEVRRTEAHTVALRIDFIRPFPPAPAAAAAAVGAAPRVMGHGVHTTPSATEACRTITRPNMATQISTIRLRHLLLASANQ
jgi:hypothetical protein